jgi:S-adenosylmethionine uptake transporter
MNNNKALSGFLFGAGGIAALTAMDAVVKSIGTELPTFQIVFIRFASTTLLLSIFLVATRRSWPKRKNFGRHAFRGTMMGVTAFLFFYGVKFIPLAVITALAMTGPIYVALLGILFLKEPLSPYLVLSVGLGIVGSLIIVLTNDTTSVQGSGNILAWIAAFLTPLTYATAFVALKQHSVDEGAVSMTLAQSAVAMFVALPLAIPGFVVPAPAIWGQVFLTGLFGTAGFLLLLFGLKRLPASALAVMDYTALLWAAAFGFFLFGETVELPLWIGGGLIITACAFGLKSTQKPAVPPTPPSGH